MVAVYVAGKGLSDRHGAPFPGDCHDTAGVHPHARKVARIDADDATVNVLQGGLGHPQRDGVAIRGVGGRLGTPVLACNKVADRHSVRHGGASGRFCDPGKGRDTTRPGEHITALTWLVPFRAGDHLAAGGSAGIAVGRVRASTRSLAFCGSLTHIL